MVILKEFKTHQPLVRYHAIWCRTIQTKPLQYWIISSFSTLSWCMEASAKPTLQSNRDIQNTCISKNRHQGQHKKAIVHIFVPKMGWSSRMFHFGMAMHVLLIVWYNFLLNSTQKDNMHDFSITSISHKIFDNDVP